MSIHEDGEVEDDMSALNIPGFGWATNVSLYRDLSIIDCNINLQDIEFPSSMPAERLLQYLKSIYSFSESFDDQRYVRNLTMAIKEKTLEYFKSKCNGKFFGQLEEFLVNKMSNNRTMYWDIMRVNPNVSFSLHAHPNIEIIFVAYGVIHEYRRQEEPSKTKFLDNSGPDLSGIKSTFVHNAVRAVEFSDSGIDKSFIINEQGSVHVTFTRNEEALLLVMWSKHHAKLAESEYPSQSWIPND